MNRVCPNCSLCADAECKKRRLAPMAAAVTAEGAVFSADCAPAVAVDIGTTTVVFAYVKNGGIARTFSAVNPQRILGADVISRIKAASDGRAELLRSRIAALLKQGIYAVTEGEDAERVVIAANTAMVHFLMGWDASGLGAYPFTAHSLDTVRTDTAALAGMSKALPVTIIPAASAFIGGDIVSGMYMCGFGKPEETALFTDIGTNGEIALSSGGRITAASAAAGPAFEGGRITNGTGAVEGAVEGVNIFYCRDLKKRRADRYYHENYDYILELETVANKPPAGICGTGIIELTAEFVRNGIIDETGLLSHRYFEGGFSVYDGISFYQSDIREVQLAKSAVRAACDTLLEREGVSWEELDTVYLAGGFSYRLNPKKAARAGFFPKTVLKKIRTVGNSALGGAAMIAADPDGICVCEDIRSRTETLALSLTDEFSSHFLSDMNFKTF